MNNKIITIILIILFTLFISNYSQAADYSSSFCSESKMVDGIYRTMYSNPERWLKAPIPTMINGWNYGWQYEPCNDEHDSICGSMVWAKGAACCGHRLEEGGAVEPYSIRIKVFDVTGDEFINDTDSSAVKEEKRRKAGLAFACLYRWKKNEYIPRSKINDIPEGVDVNDWIMDYLDDNPMIARTVIQNWLNTEPSLPSSQIPYVEEGGYDYDENYGSIKIGGTSYNAKSYIASKTNVLNCNEAKMSQDKKNGIEPTVKRKTLNGKNCTIIGPYRIDIKR